jgi:hypothetical protein
MAIVTTAFAALSITAACHRAPVAATLTGNPRIAADSLQGIIKIVGSEPFPQTTLSFDDGSPALVLDSAAALKSVAGLRVAVIGVRQGRRMVVDRFMVLSANGIEAMDGTLTLDDGDLILVRASGARQRLARPPPSLRALAGRRVWVSGDLSREVVAFGIIR